MIRKIAPANDNAQTQKVATTVAAWLTGVGKARNR